MMFDEDSSRFNRSRRGFSVKPGRGPSAFGALTGIGAAIFGVLWTILAFAITRDAPFPLVGIIFPLFGVVFVVMGIARVIYDLRNATAQERNSLVDVVPEEQEMDPLNRRFGRSQAQAQQQGSGGAAQRGAAGSGGAATVEARLQALDQLRGRGLVTEVEYAEQRARILREL